MNWESVIGLEVHAELATQSKIFCGCSTTFGQEPNTQVCPVCAGMPGVLPRLNRTVVEYAVRVGLALNCDITHYSKFDRKNYFYPDLPKAYQVSQLYAPICRDGHLDINVDGTSKTIGIREIHMEEDAGKLIHDASSDNTLMDFSRCGVPLIEIVTQPDFRSAAEVLAYLMQLREILLYLGVCDCKMQEGSLRADINLSIRPEGGELGVRTEMKNLNSFKAIGHAIAYETQRQIALLESGRPVVQETRRWDDDAGKSYSMRSKENAPDYRYFPEPDLLPIQIDEAWLQAIAEHLPELAQSKRERYMRTWAISELEAVTLTSHVNLAQLFEKVTALSQEPLESAHLVSGEIMRLMNQTNTLPEDLVIDAGKLATLVTLVTAAKINRNAYKEAIEAVFMHDVDPDEYISQKGLLMVSDADTITQVVAAVVAEQQQAVADYRGGQQKALGFLIGQVMKKLQGKGNPELVRKTVLKALE
jgi:aspartyl-tRNA(Asn)/glutamyl-tRNA(Gln) amidotransferase subunit B